MKKVIDLVDIDLQGCFKDGDLSGCDEVCGKRDRRSYGDTWWWNEEVKETYQERKVDTRCVGIVVRRIRTGMKASKIKAKNAVSKTMTEKSEEMLTGVNKLLK